MMEEWGEEELAAAAAAAAAQEDSGGAAAATRHGCREEPWEEEGHVEGRVQPVWGCRSEGVGGEVIQEEEGGGVGR